MVAQQRQGDELARAQPVRLERSLGTRSRQAREMVEQR